MNLLAIDTSTEYLSLALQLGQQVLTFHEQAGPKASERILPEIQALLAQENVTLKDLDGIAYGAGPGAFTGVRVAVGVTQGLAFGAQLPVVGVNTLMAVAQASGENKVITCLDARMGEVYHAAFERVGNDWQTILPATVCKPEDVPSIKGDAWVGTGTGWQAYDAVLQSQYASQVTKQLPDVYPLATATLALAQPLFALGKTQAAHEAAPIYIRNRVALTSKEREQGQRL